jgi:hypothetical protein
MAKQHEEAPETQILNTSNPPADQRISMSVDDLKALILQITTSQAEGTKALAEALRDSKIPYIDPKVAENEETFRKNTREQQERKRKQMMESQEWCEHTVGGLGEVRDPGGRTSIAWHRFDNGATVGICTQCIRVIRESDPDFRKWFNKPKGNPRMSRSGDRFVERTTTAAF